MTTICPKRLRTECSKKITGKGAQEVGPCSKKKAKAHPPSLTPPSMGGGEKEKRMHNTEPK